MMAVVTTRPREGAEHTQLGSRYTDGKRDSLVIIPTYNEVANLERLVKAVLALRAFDVLIVDDKSPDGTGELADVLALEHRNRVAVLHRPGKNGLGRAYVCGFHYALAHAYSRVFEMDADFSHNPASLLTLRSALDNADVVLGSRYVPGGLTSHWPAWRRALSRGGSRYASIILGLPIRDLTGGFKGFRSIVLSSIDLDAIQSNGYAFQIEVTYRCQRRGFRIVETPIVFVDRRIGRSKMHVRIVVEALLVVWRLRLESARGLHARRVPT